MGDLDLARTPSGQELRLYGVLRIVGTGTTFMKCGDESRGQGSPCCNQVAGVVAIFDVRDVESFRMPRALLLGEDFICRGDDSALCCQIDAVCRTVVVTGRVAELVADGSLRGTADERRHFGAGIKLDVTSLCVVDRPSHAR